MPGRKTVDIDKLKLKQLIEERGFNYSSLANEIGVDKESIRNYVLNETIQPSLPVFKMMCYTFGISEDELKKKEPVAKSAVSQIIEDTRTADAINALSAKLDSLASDLGKLAAVILDIQKVSNENKAQAELNRDELAAIINKTTEVNSTVNKILGNQKRHY